MEQLYVTNFEQPEVQLYETAQYGYIETKPESSYDLQVTRLKRSAFRIP